MAKPRKQYTKTPQRKHKKKSYAPGVGGLIGSGLGYVRKNFTSAGSTANKALKLARRLADAVNIEYKEINFAATSVTTTYAGNSQTLNAPNQGVGNGQRIGDSLKVQNASIKGFINAGSSAEIWRLMLIWDKENIITPSNLLDYVSTVNVINGQKQESTKYNSLVLFDQTYRMQPNSTNSIVPFQIFVPVNTHTNFLPGAVTITTGALKFMYWSTTSAASTSTMNYIGYVSYTDD